MKLFIQVQYTLYVCGNRMIDLLKLKVLIESVYRSDEARVLFPEVY